MKLMAACACSEPGTATSGTALSASDAELPAILEKSSEKELQVCLAICAPQLQQLALDVFVNILALSNGMHIADYHILTCRTLQELFHRAAEAAARGDYSAAAAGRFDDTT
jgi:hypothetical protein